MNSRAMRRVSVQVRRAHVRPRRMHDDTSRVMTQRTLVVPTGDARLRVRLFPVHAPALTSPIHVSKHLVLQGCEHV